MRELFFATLYLFIYSMSFSQNIAGSWKGNIDANGNIIPIVFHLFKDTSGQINGKWDSPKQKAMGLPFSKISVEKDSVFLEIKMIGGSYTGKFVGKDSIAGMWHQGGGEIVLNLSRSYETESVGEKTIFLPDEKEITVTSSGACKLYGTLLSKSNKQKLAIIIAGSGPTDRDGNNTLGDEANSYKMLAYALDSQNIATFRYDKRGVGKSIPSDFNESELIFDDYIKDAEKIYSYFSDSVGFKEIYFIGHSEGSLIGMIASQKMKAEGFISIAGSGRPIDEVIEEQLNAGTLSDSLKKKVPAIFKELKKGKEVGNVPSGLDFLFRKSVQPYFISWLKYNPATEIKKLDCPVLILQGTCDNQITIGDAEILHKANTKSTLDIIPLMTHTLKNTDANCMDANSKTYLDPTLPINRELVNAIVAFIKTHK